MKLKWEKDPEWYEWYADIPNENNHIIVVSVEKLSIDCYRWRIDFCDAILDGRVGSYKNYKSLASAKRSCERYLNKLAKTILAIE